MTTDRPAPGDGAAHAGDPDERRERLERLRQRRPAAGPGPDAPRAGGASGVPARSWDTPETPERPARRSRRRHAAKRSRVLVAGLSASAALGLLGAMAGPPRSAGRSTPTDAPAAPTVVVVPWGGGAPAPAAPGRAPAVTRTTAPPVTTSHAS